MSPLRRLGREKYSSGFLGNSCAEEVKGSLTRAGREKGSRQHIGLLLISAVGRHVLRSRRLRDTNRIWLARTAIATAVLCIPNATSARPGLAGRAGMLSIAILMACRVCTEARSASRREDARRRGQGSADRCTSRLELIFLRRRLRILDNSGEEYRRCASCREEAGQSEPA